MDDTNVYLWYKCSLFETDEGKAKHEPTKQLLVSLVNNFKFPNLHRFLLLLLQFALHSAKCRVHITHLLFPELIFFLPQVCAKLICLLLTDPEQLVCMHAACSAAEAAITKTPLTLPARHISKQIYICLCLLCGFLQFYYYMCPTCDNFKTMFSLDNIYIMQAKPVFIPTDNLQLLSASNTIPRDTDLRANASATPLLLDSPSAPQLRALLCWQTGAFMLVGRGRWAAEEQCHPPLTPASPGTARNGGTTALPKAHQQCACSCTLVTQPGLTLSSRGNKVRRHPVPLGLSWAGRKVWAGSLWSASGLYDTNAHNAAPPCCFASFCFPSICLFQNVSNFSKK